MHISLKDKVAFVTGGTRGIGKAIVSFFARSGADVFFTYRSSSEVAYELERSLKDEVNASVTGVQVDATSFEEAQLTVDRVVKDLGRLDILICNAGVTRDSLILRMTEDQWNETLANNLTSAFNYIRAASKVMVRQRTGRILVISSVVGFMGNPGQANYAASKAGLIGLVKSVAKELATRNVTANAIAPGWIDTDMTSKLTDEQRKAFLASLPSNRAGTPDDVAATALFLSSDYASYITGEVIRVDGGLGM